MLVDDGGSYADEWLTDVVSWLIKGLMNLLRG